MASQWIINNKKVKDWTIGGKKVKSLTLANGKVINFGSVIVPSVKTIYAKDYTGITYVSDDLYQRNYAIEFDGYTGDFFANANNSFPQLSGTINIEAKIGGSFRISKDVTTKNVKIKSGEVGFTWTAPTMPSHVYDEYIFEAGHTYEISNNSFKDLGLRRENLVVKSSEYTSIDMSYADSKWYALSGYNALDPAAEKMSFTIDVKSDMQLTQQITWYDEGFTNQLWYQTLSNDITLVSGHKYQFENGKDPIDLGEYGTTTPSIQTIKSTEYNDVYQTNYIDNGKNASSIQFNYIRGDSLKVFDILNASTDILNPTEISGKLIIETGHNALSFTNIDYIRLSYEDTTSNTFKYLKYTPPKQITFEMRGGRKYQFETNILPVDLSTEEFKNEIDALPWAQLSNVSYAPINSEIGYSSIIGAPSLPQDVTARVQNQNISSSGVVNVPILFSKGNITYMKTVSIDFKIKIISAEINSLNWHNLTYINDGSINQNSIIYNDIAGKPLLPQDIEVTNITSDQIISSGIYDVNITFRYTTNHLSTYTKTVSIAFTINPPKAQIIKATDYTSIAYAGGGITITGGTPTTAWSSVSSSSYAQLSKSIAIEVKNDVDCTTRMPYFDWGGTGFTYNAGGNFTLQAGHKYMFENGSLPTDLGTY